MPLNNKNQSTERFKFRNEPLNDKQENNISCNWLLISGGLKEFSKQSNLKTLNKYGIIKMIRQIDGINYYGITQKLFTHLEKTLEEKDMKDLLKNKEYLMNSSLRTRFNKLLKQKKSQKSIQIEHLMGGVKSLVEKMINSKNFKAEHLKIIHKDHTLCCYKLKCETGIDEKLKPNELSEIKLAPKP